MNEVTHELVERNELFRLAAAAAIRRAQAGQDVDPAHLRWALDFVDTVPPLGRPLTQGLPS